MAFDGGLAPFAGGFFAIPEDAWTASLARMTAAFASRSSSRTWGALCEDRSVTSEINASILAIRFRTFFDFMTTPIHDHSAVDFAEAFDCKVALGPQIFPPTSTSVHCRPMVSIVDAFLLRHPFRIIAATGAPDL
jgi:hypothetical protein